MFYRKKKDLECQSRVTIYLRRLYEKIKKNTNGHWKLILRLFDTTLLVAELGPDNDEMIHNYECKSAW